MTQPSTSTPLQRAYVKAVQHVLQLWLRDNGYITRRCKGITTKFFFPKTVEPYVIIDLSKAVDYDAPASQPLTEEVLNVFIDGSTAYLDRLAASGEHEDMLAVFGLVSEPLDALFVVTNGSPLTAHLKLRGELLTDTEEVTEWENPLKYSKRLEATPTASSPSFAVTPTLPTLPPLPQF